MPPEVNVEVYLPCPKGALPGLVEQFRRLLDSLGYTGHDSDFWDGERGWDADGDYYGPGTHRACPVTGLTVAGRDLLGEVSVLGWTSSSISDLRGYWVSLEFGFDTEGEEQRLVGRVESDPAPLGMYFPGVGRALWHVMRAYARTWPTRPIFCTYEGWWGVPWQALTTDEGNLWSFDAALIPLDLRARFSPLPEDYVSEIVPEGLALAPRSR